MLRRGKRDWIANIVAGWIQRLAKRSVRLQLLFEEIGRRLFLGSRMNLDAITLPAARPRYDATELSEQTDEFNRAAERYFVASDRDYLIGKPFTDRIFFARRLFDLGVLFHWLRVAPGDVVLELGAGSCWVSHLLNRYGCKTIAIDVSATALEMGRQLFETDQQTNWDMRPEFIVYDGYTLPLEDRSVDRIVVYDAFHHIPNYERVLSEMARVLRHGGIVGMREPGRRHAAAEKSLAEVHEFGVLENDIVVEDIERLGQMYGLDRTTIVPLTIDESIEVPASALGEFMQAKNLDRFWTPLCTALVCTNFILMYKGVVVPDTRRPRRLRARILPRPQKDPLILERGAPAKLTVEIQNDGDTRWLAEAAGTPGRTQLGLRLHAGAGSGRLLDRDWQRVPLPRDVSPGESIVLAVDLRTLDRSGRFLVRFDMVAEDIAWFADVDSPTSELSLHVVERAR